MRPRSPRRPRAWRPRAPRRPTRTWCSAAGSAARRDALPLPTRPRRPPLLTVRHPRANVGDADAVARIRRCFWSRAGFEIPLEVDDEEEGEQGIGQAIGKAFGGERSDGEEGALGEGRDDDEPEGQGEVVSAL